MKTPLFRRWRKLSLKINMYVTPLTHLLHFTCAINAPIYTAMWTPFVPCLSQPTQFSTYVTIKIHHVDKIIILYVNSCNEESSWNAFDMRLGMNWSLPTVMNHLAATISVIMICSKMSIVLHICYCWRCQPSQNLQIFISSKFHWNVVHIL